MDGVLAISHVDVQGKTVLVRLDLNVPLENGTVTDATRIVRAAAGLQDLSKRGARVVILSHLGRPKGKVDASASLHPVAAALEGILGRPVTFVSDCIGDDVARDVNALSDGDIAMLENVRFYAGEEKDDPAFAGQLAAIGDVFVNDAFSVSHRAHASLHALAKALPAYAGPSLAAEINALERVLEQPEHPTAALVGGAKVSSKISVLEHLLPRMDSLIIGGGMANTFLLALGKSIGDSLAEPDLVPVAKRIMERAKDTNCDIVLPIDVVVADTFAAHAPHQTLGVDDVGDRGMILDVGARSITDLKQRLGGFKTLLWNGPLGAFELEPFGTGTFSVAQSAGMLAQEGKLVAVAGGGDTVAALNAANATEKFTYVSTAGGAFLEWLEGKVLPGISVLKHS